jgi:hypothetical protein
MKNIQKTTGVAVCGLVTSLLTALVVAFIERLTGFDLFTLTIWFVVPVGAVATGCAAASGYYFGSLYFHTRPTLLLLLQMVIVAGFTQAMIYYAEYFTLILDDGRRVSDLIPFRQYLDISLTSAHYRFGRGAQIDLGEIGNAGYGLAALQFVGFLVGGLGIFLILHMHPLCASCKNYLRVLTKAAKAFASYSELESYHVALFSLPVGSPEFVQLAAVDHNVPLRPGTWALEMTLYGCPTCKAQALRTEFSVLRGKEWKTVHQLTSMVAVPSGIDLGPALRRKS